ncbi:MAG: c-type cytochrome [Planctomycetes bacterium]|nr:c-type cytochrome [Planctomycetota bacterium]
MLRLSGGGDDYARTQLELAGAFTVEAWVRLDPGLSNADGILAKPGEFDLNFHDAHPRLWLGPRGDVLVSQRRVEAETWTHVALVRDAAGELALYLDGELDATASLGDVPTHAGLDVGRTNPPAGCAARLAEVRVWRTARSAAEIGASFRTRVTSDRRPADLVLLLPGDDVELSGAARVEGALDAPPVLTDAERAAEEALFARYRELAARAGDATRGREVFRATCAACHKVGGEGGAIGPVLDGVGAKGREGLLRAILTPSAGVESGYRTLVVRTTGGELLDGFLAAEDDEAIVLRRKDREDLRLPRAEIASARFDRLSLMPAGQLEALADADAVDLLSFLQSLR